MGSTRNAQRELQGTTLFVVVFLDDVVLLHWTATAIAAIVIPIDHVFYKGVVLGIGTKWNVRFGMWLGNDTSNLGQPKHQQQDGCRYGHCFVFVVIYFVGRQLVYVELLSFEIYQSRCSVYSVSCLIPQQQ